MLWYNKITPMTKFKVINRFVDVDGTKWLEVYGALCAYLKSYVFVYVDGTLSDFMRTILAYLFCEILSKSVQWIISYPYHNYPLPVNHFPLLRKLLTPEIKIILFRYDIFEFMEFIYIYWFYITLKCSYEMYQFGSFETVF